MVITCRLHELLVLAASSSIRLFISGIWFTPGILYVAFLNDFRGSAGVTSWIASLQYFVSSVTCPVAGLLIKRFGNRVVTLTGGCVMTFGLLVSIPATHIAHVFLSFGVITGIGSGMAYIGSMEALTASFTKHRNMAFGIGGFVANMGNVIYPPLLQTLIDEYGWRGMFLVISGLDLNIAVAAILFAGNKTKAKNKKREITRTCTLDTTAEGPSHSDSAAVTLLEGRDFPNDNTKHICNTVSSNCRPEPEHNTAKTSYSYCGKFRLFLRKHPILPHPGFLVILVCGTLLCFSGSVVMGHLAAYVIDRKLAGDMEASVLYSAGGISMSLTKLLQGVVITNNRVRPVVVFVVLVFTGGVFTFVFLFSIPLPVLYVYSVVFSASYASHGGALVPAMMIQVGGRDEFAFAYGLYCCVTSLGCLVGAPAAGWLYDWSHDYRGPFTMAAAGMVASALLMFLSRGRIAKAPSTTSISLSEQS